MQVNKHQTLRRYVLQQLLKGYKLNQRDFLRDRHSWRLSAIIHDSEKIHGIKISRRRIAGGAAEYFLTPDEIKQYKQKENNSTTRP